MQPIKGQKPDPLIEAYQEVGEEISCLNTCKINKGLTYLHSMAIGIAFLTEKQIDASAQTVL